MNTRNKKRYYALKSQGLCVLCGKNKTTKVKCDQCKSMLKKRRAKRADAGLCDYAACANQRALGKTMCEQHLQQVGSSIVALRRKRKMIGLCVCGKCPPLPNTSRCATCQARIIELRKTKRDRVFNHYGGYICKCCGETIELFLTIDHINGGGNNHRKKIGKKIINWLIRNDLPPGYQVLCFNCNCGRSKNNGICPHHTLPKASVESLAIGHHDSGFVS